MKVRFCYVKPSTKAIIGRLSSSKLSAILKVFPKQDDMVPTAEKEDQTELHKPWKNYQCTLSLIA